MRRKTDKGSLLTVAAPRATAVFRDASSTISSTASRKWKRDEETGMYPHFVVTILQLSLFLWEQETAHVRTNQRR